MPSGPSRARWFFVLTAAGFAWLSRYVYTDIFAAVGVFDYMGIRTQPVSLAVSVLFFTIAIVPAFAIPVHVRRPSDVVQLYLYYAVHIQTAVLVPVVSHSGIWIQLAYCGATTVALFALGSLHALPRVELPRVALSPREFWLAIAAGCALILFVFYRSGLLTLANFSLVDVYEQRADLSSRAGELGSAFFYLANWTGAAVAPFLMVMGLHSRRRLLVLGGALLALAAFVVSSNRAFYAAIPAVIGGYYVLRRSQGRHFASVMGLGFSLLLATTLFIDSRFSLDLGGGPIPAVTWQVFFRTFSNNGFLSAIYLDLFQQLDFAYYADSFLRWLPGHRLPAPVPVLAGISFTTVPDVHANANVWADAFANLGFLGIAFAATLTTGLLWVYNSIASRVDHLVAASALIVPATVLANTSAHTAFLSNGLIVVFLLIYMLPATTAAPRLAR
jgi:hypothetical protein